MQLLFIAAHLAGGAGKAIIGMCNYLSECNIGITILTLEETQNKQYVRQLNKKITLVVSSDLALIQQMCQIADAVIINWWAHPLMFPVILLFERVAVRVILWCHINGCGYPVLESKFLLKAHRIFFTCTYSYENDLLEEEMAQIRQNSTVIYGMGEFEPESLCHKETYSVNNVCKIGYLGTLDYNKLNRDFVKICEKVADVIPDVEFLLYGECSREVQEDIDKSTIKDQFRIMGFSNDSIQSLMSMDILAYPLNPTTSGTTENVILEAMAAGVPVVALKQGTEKNIIRDGENGVLADNVIDFPDKIIELLSDEKLREKIGKNARKYVIKQYDGRDNANKFIAEVEEVLKQKKKCIIFSDYVGQTPYEWFLSCCGCYKCSIEKFVCENETSDIEDILYVIGNMSKSSVRQFFRYYSEDNNIMKICSHYFI